MSAHYNEPTASGRCEEGHAEEIEEVEEENHEINVL